MLPETQESVTQPNLEPALNINQHEPVKRVPPPVPVRLPKTSNSCNPITNTHQKDEKAIELNSETRRPSEISLLKRSSLRNSFAKILSRSLKQD